ncbi:MAG TPA: hypothetical protein PKI62_09695 [bacterium]|nr:hypothetical protein [bacterium]HPR87740.1 hypothetical protein [bacterium]
MPHHTPVKRGYRGISLVMALLFGLVGMLFLFLPELVLRFFDRLSPIFGLAPSPATGARFFLILATAYMYLVTLLAAMMFRHPRETVYPRLLIHAKSASALLSFALFLFQSPLLVYLTNGLVDGGIALGVYALARPQRQAWR